jgi:hypothetical protein
MLINVTFYRRKLSRRRNVHWVVSYKPSDIRCRCSLIVPYIHSYMYILPSPLITTSFTEVTTRPLTLYPSIKIFLSFLLGISPLLLGLGKCKTVPHS